MFIHHPYSMIRRGAGLLAFLLLLVISPTSGLLAQEEPESSEEATEEEAEAEPELISSRLSLTITQMPGDSAQLQALLRAKIDGVFQKISDAPITFAAAGETEEISLAEATTDAVGLASIIIDKSKIWKNEGGYLTFFARFAGNEQLEGSEEEVSILPANLTIEAVPDDSTYSIVVKLTAPSADGEMPLPEASVILKVKRMVGFLPVGEGTTDEEGMVEINFPTDLSGDDKGNLYISALIEEFEEYGNLSAATVQPWGKPVSTAFAEMPRALWSPYPPAWLLITFLGFLAVIWGHYMHVFIELRRIKKAVKVTEDSPA